MREPGPASMAPSLARRTGRPRRVRAAGFGDRRGCRMRGAPLLRTNQLHARRGCSCARLVRPTGANLAHPDRQVRPVRGLEGARTGERTNQAHPPIPPRGACGQLAAAPELTARASSSCAKFVREVRERRARGGAAWFLPRPPRPSWRAGTAAIGDRVCFGCPSAGREPPPPFRHGPRRWPMSRTTGGLGGSSQSRAERGTAGRGRGQAERKRSGIRDPGREHRAVIA